MSITLRETYSYVMSILNLDDAPADPIERIMWLSGVAEAVRRELDAEYAEAYFNARLQRRLQAAIDVGTHSRRQVLAYTRAENERRARIVRWGDGADPTSTAFKE